MTAAPKVQLINTVAAAALSLLMFKLKEPKHNMALQPQSLTHPESLRFTVEHVNM